MYHWQYFKSLEQMHRREVPILSIAEDTLFSWTISIVLRWLEFCAFSIHFHTLLSVPTLYQVIARLKAIFQYSLLFLEVTENPPVRSTVQKIGKTQASPLLEPVVSEHMRKLDSYAFRSGELVTLVQYSAVS